MFRKPQQAQDKRLENGTEDFHVYKDTCSNSLPSCVLSGPAPS